MFDLFFHDGPSALDARLDQRRFSAAERRGRLCVVASPDGRKGSLRIDRAVVVYSAILEVGQHVVCDLSGGRDAWLHLIVGMVAVRDVLLTSGDSAWFEGERVAALTAREGSEILLVART